MLGLILACLKLVARTTYAVLKILPTQNKVILISRKNRVTSIDFKLLVDRLAIDYPDVSTVVLNHPLEGAVRSLGRFFSEMYHLATARAVVIDSYVPAVSLLDHKSDLIIVQIWHALGAIKKFGRQILDQPEGSSTALAEAMRMHKNYSYVTAGSQVTAPIYAVAFGIDQTKVKPIGMPRVDYLLDTKQQETNRAKVLEAFPELDGKQVVLYAPTFRKQGEVSPSELAAKLGPSYRLLVSQHRLDKTELTPHDNMVINRQFDVMDLLPVADTVVTDYSAIVFEAAILAKPLYFYAYDLKDYETARGLNVDYRLEMPGLVAEDSDSLVAAIKTDKYNLERIKNFADNYVTVRDASCTSRIVELLELENHQ